jgi:hypothetical protein
MRLSIAERGMMKETNNEIGETKFGIRKGSAILIVLHSPREKTWGILEEITSAGVFLRGLDLNSFDDWLRAVVHNEPFVGFGDLFFPLWRVERISRDESSAELPSLSEQVERRTGRPLEEVIGSLN